MFERIICLFVAVLSIFSVFYSSQHMEIYSDVSYIAKANYVDVYFTDVKSIHGSEVTLTSNHKKIQVDSMMLENVGDSEVIQYEVFNNSISYDVDVEVYVNGVREYDSQFFHISTSDIGTLSSGEAKSGSITITYQKASIDGVELPFEVELKVIPKEKGYLE